MCWKQQLRKKEKFKVKESTGTNSGFISENVNIFVKLDNRSI